MNNIGFRSLLKDALKQMLLAGAVAMLLVGTAAADEVLDRVHDLQTRWARIYYKLPEKEQSEAYERLAAQAHALTQEFPDRAEPVIWEGIILSSRAGSMRGFSMLKAGGVAKQARERLLQAEQIDPTAMHGSIYTSLGTLYDEAPGWPLSFGDDDKARAYLQRALELNPDGIDPNYFWGNYLRGQGDIEGARAAYRKALQAPARPGRELADAGRRAEARLALEELE